MDWKVSAWPSEIRETEEGQERRFLASKRTIAKQGSPAETAVGGGTPVPEVPHPAVPSKETSGFILSDFSAFEKALCETNDAVSLKAHFLQLQSAQDREAYELSLISSLINARRELFMELSEKFEGKIARLKNKSAEEADEHPLEFVQGSSQ